jgi:hypothetical protein
MYDIYMLEEEDRETSNPTQWSNDIENVLGKIRENCIMMSNYHKIRYYNFKSLLKYFRIPTIILSAANSVFSVGLQPYMGQETISLITCMIALFVGVINSIELFLAIQSTMEQELTTSKDFYILSIDIYKMILLNRNHRSIDGKTFLDDKYSIYCKLFEGSQLMNKEINDRLVPLLSIDNRSTSTSTSTLVNQSMFNSPFYFSSSAYSSPSSELTLVPPSNTSSRYSINATPSDATSPAGSTYINIRDDTEL